MAIAHVLASLEVGGGERVALHLAAGQRRGGAEVLVVSLAAGPEGALARELVAVGADVRTVARRGGLDPTLPARLAALFRRARVGVVHSHNPLALLYAAPAGRLVGATVVHTKHGEQPDAPRRLWLRRLAARLCHAVVAVTESTAEVARRTGEAPPGRLSVIGNGIDLGPFAPDGAARREVRTELGLPEEAWLLLTVGRLEPVKDHALLVRAAAPLLGERARLVIVGEGSEGAALSAQVDALGAGGRFVHLVGARRDVGRLMAAADAFVLSSRSEGQPLVVLEAMAAGLPVVATAVGGLPALVEEGRTGLLAPAGDEGALRARLAALAADPVGARSWGAAGRAIAVERFSAERMVRDYQALYERVRRA